MIDLEFKTTPSSIQENLNINMTPENIVQHYAKEKSLDIARSYPGFLVIGADTVVVLKNKILGKPKNKLESFAMLKSLSGMTHSVYTGVSIHHISHQISLTFYEKTDVSFLKYSDSTISYYIDKYNPLDKAGSYGIQDWFAINVSKINGCFYNVMGFPLSAFYIHYRQIVNK